jgi:hypothetical protein
VGHSSSACRCQLPLSNRVASAGVSHVAIKHCSVAFHQRIPVSFTFVLFPRLSCLVRRPVSPRGSDRTAGLSCKHVGAGGCRRLLWSSLSVCVCLTRRSFLPLCRSPLRATRRFVCAQRNGRIYQTRCSGRAVRRVQRSIPCEAASSRCPSAARNNTSCFCSRPRPTAQRQRHVLYCRRRPCPFYTCFCARSRRTRSGAQELCPYLQLLHVLRRTGRRRRSTCRL